MMMQMQMQMQSSACNSSSCRSFSLLVGLPQADYFLNRVRVLRRSSSSNRFPSCQTCVSCGILPIPPPPPPPPPIGGGSLIRNIYSVEDMVVTSSSSTLLITTENERHHLFRFKQYHRRRRTDDRRLLVSAVGSSSGVSSVKGEEEFQAEVLEEKEVAVLVEFVADWCGPCRLMSSIIHWASQEYKGRLKVVKIDHDLNPKLIEEYKVFGLPALILFHNGKEVPESRWEGAMTKAKLKEYLERLLDPVNAT